MLFRCPLCKVKFKKSDLKANKQLEEDISKTTTACVCGDSIYLNKFNDHTAKCQQYKANIYTNINQSIIKDAKQIVNRSTFNCPCCIENNFDREALLKHVAIKHKHEQTVCPICVCQPWGDPNYKTNLHGHLQKRHKFDYDTTVKYNEDEDEVLKRVLEESMNYK